MASVLRAACCIGITLESLTISARFNPVSLPLHPPSIPMNETPRPADDALCKFHWLVDVAAVFYAKALKDAGQVRGQGADRPMGGATGKAMGAAQGRQVPCPCCIFKFKLYYSRDRCSPLKPVAALLRSFLP